MLIKIVVIALCDLLPAARPDRLHGVQSLGYDLDFFSFALLLSGLLVWPFIDDGIGDEVRILVDNHGKLPTVRVVLNPVFRIDWLQVESDVCSAAGLFRVLHGVRAVPSRFPEMCLFLTSTASQNGDFICHHKRGVEANTKLPDQLSNIFSRLRSFDSLPQLLRS